jgi:hypothetical protein
MSLRALPSRDWRSIPRSFHLICGQEPYEKDLVPLLLGDLAGGPMVRF